MSALKTAWWQLNHVLGIPPHTPSYREQFASVVTATLAMVLVALTGHWFAPVSSPWLLTSMGATAILVFAAPHGPLSQPWALVGGHLLSATTALAVVHCLGGGVVSMALAVGGAIAVMHMARALHPPGGATALYIVQSLHESGALPAWSLLLSPVLLNLAFILVAACLFNYPFPWRRYPAGLAFRHQPQALHQLSHEAPFSQRELARALDGLDAVVTITDEQLQLIYEAILKRQVLLPLQSEQLVMGGFYSNGLSGEAWAVRQIIDGNDISARKPQLIVKTISGQGRGTVQHLTRQAFVDWASYPVYPDQDHWVRDFKEM